MRFTTGCVCLVKRGMFMSFSLSCFLFLLLSFERLCLHSLFARLDFCRHTTGTLGTFQDCHADGCYQRGRSPSPGAGRSDHSRGAGDLCIGGLETETHTRTKVHLVSAELAPAPQWRLEPQNLQHSSGMVMRAEEAVSLCDPLIDWVYLVIVQCGSEIRVAEISRVPRSKVSCTT